MNKWFGNEFIKFLFDIYKRNIQYHLFHIIIIYSFFYYYSHGTDFNDHGYFNFIGGIIIISLLLLAILPFYGFAFLIKKIIK